MSKFLLCYSFLVVISLTILRSPMASAWIPSGSTTTVFSTCNTLLQLHHSDDAESNDMDHLHSRRRFLVQNTMFAAATITASTTALTLLTTTPTAHAATTDGDVAVATDKTIQNQRSSNNYTGSDPFATPPKMPEIETPSPWTNMSAPTLSEEEDMNGVGGAVEGATTDFSRTLQKYAKKKNVDPRTHG